jgi:hypothetical protein
MGETIDSAPRRVGNGVEKTNPMEDPAMKTVILLAVALVTFSSFPLMFAQQGSSTPPGNSGNAQVSAPAGTSNADATEMRPVNGELLNKLDSKTAKTGDSVVVRTEQKVTIASGTVIPKGSRLVGHVTEVQASGKGSANSKMTIQFDRAELKGGQNLPILSVIQSLAPPETAATEPDTSGAGSMGGAPAAGGMSGAHPGGGSAANANTATNVGPADTGAEPAASSGSNSPPAGKVVARSGNFAIRTTAIPGVLIARNESGQPLPNASGVLFGAQQNIHLDGGTKMVLSVSAAGPGGN